MSLTSYRAAPPRDKPLRAFAKTETIWPTPEAPIPSGGFLRRQPGPKPLGAGRMYQRKTVLERPASDLFGVLLRSKRALEPFPFRLNRNGALMFILTRFLHRTGT